MRTLAEAVNHLPAGLRPARDLWPGIARRIAEPEADTVHKRVRRRASDVQVPPRPARRRPVRAWGYGTAAILLLFFVLYQLYDIPEEQAGWAAAALQGTPRIGARNVAGSARLHANQWLETDGVSRARLEVAGIGELELAPNSRLRMLESSTEGHRVELAQGRMEASIWAPPRLFFVRTPAALAIDLGCAYTLDVDSAGNTLLHVTAGYVELEHAIRYSVVPAGMLCRSCPDLGPGTPYHESATEAFRQALFAYDFAEGGSLRAVLATARPEDAATLWYILCRESPAARGHIYESLAQLAPPPAGVERRAVIAGDSVALAGWGRTLGIAMWKRYPADAP